MQQRLAPGARVTIRDEDWGIRRIDLSDDGGHALTCDGLSELVRGTSASFLDRLEDDIQIHDPAHTQLFQDASDYFTDSLLYLESLIWLLDPTAISDPDDYTRADPDRKDLFVRRFKKNIKGQAEGQFAEPVTRRLSAWATPQEEVAFQSVLEIPFTQTGARAQGKQGELQRVGLQKALFSSPAAAGSYARNRIDKLRRRPAPSDAEKKEIAAFETFLRALDAITPERFSKYQRLLTALCDPQAQWTGKDSKDRLVIFSKRIETLKWLMSRLPGDLHLEKNAFKILDGGLSDVDQQEIVERFGQEHDSLRVLLCSDVASEGLNLHYFAHRLVHFDLPWSPMVFQQRNGRVDRFGQERTPRIDYLLTASEIETVKGDLRVIEVLVRKDEQVSRNIGDPASILRKHSSEEEERVVADALASGMSAEQFERECIEQAAAPDDAYDWEADFFGAGQQQAPPAPIPPEPHRFFPDVYAFAKQAISRIPEAAGYRIDDQARMLRLTPPADLRRRLRRQLPAEVLRETDEYLLSAHPGLVEESIQRAREADRQGAAWPDIQYLWPQHPICQWLIDRVIGDLGRRRAPVITSRQLAADECAFLMLGLIPNRKGQPLIAEWKAVVRRGDQDHAIEDFGTFCACAGIAERGLPNARHALDLTAVQQALGDAVATMQLFVEDQVKRYPGTAKPLNAAPLSTECVRLVYRLIFLFYIEARSELGYVPIDRSAVYTRGYSLEHLRDLVRFPNHLWQGVLRGLSFAKDPKTRRTRRVSYQALSINQLGAVYESLLAYRGFFAAADLYEVMPEVKQPTTTPDDDETGEDADADGREDAYGGTTDLLGNGWFVTKDKIGDYTPQSLTRCLVKYALKELLRDKTADEVLTLRVLEPAMGSAAFLNEAVNQLAQAYLERKQQEQKRRIPHDQFAQELQKVRMRLADTNVFGVDLNPIATELAEVSLWLNAIYGETDDTGRPKPARVPWFGYQLFNGNSLVGARPQVFSRSQVTAPRRINHYESDYYGKTKSEPNPNCYLYASPRRVTPTEPRRDDEVYHFLLPDEGMCDYTNKAVKDSFGAELERVKTWKKGLVLALSDLEVRRLTQLSARIDTLWQKHARQLAQDRVRTEDNLPVWPDTGEAPSPAAPARRSPARPVC